MDRIERQNTILPLIPLREVVTFPSAIVPILVGRERSVNALRYAVEQYGNVLFLSIQKNQVSSQPSVNEIAEVGVIARIERWAEQENGSFRVVVNGLERARINRFLKKDQYLLVSLSPLSEVADRGPNTRQLAGELIAMFEEYVAYKRVKMHGIVARLDNTRLAEITDIVASLVDVPLPVKQALLEELDVGKRALKVLNMLKKEIHKLRTAQEAEVRSKREDGGSDIDEYRKKIAELPGHAQKRAAEELERLEMMPPFSAESTVSRSYLDWLLSVPWTRVSPDTNDLKRATDILNSDHHGLEKVKDRILDYLAVRQLVKKPSGEILCFVGPPGVGKSSLSKSIARALNREFVRISLGGVRDEAEIRGHRRTYVGSYPGQIIKGLKKAGYKNPVFLLDEIDKLNSDFKGDPASALLEVLDPEQNGEFVDHYLDLEVDLSQVFFVTTANSTDPIPAPLRDRMEIIELPGYTEREKLSIAREYLVKKQAELNGLKPGDFELSDELLLEIINSYTREAGVRGLDRTIAVVMRKIARHFVESGKGDADSDSPGAFVLTETLIRDYLGIPKFNRRQVLEKNEVGVSIGLAWTQVGGDILIIESRSLRGRGELILTGSLGDVMKESSSTAFSYAKIKLSQLEFDTGEIEKNNIHLHLPEGAVPKEGPSAGVTIAVSIMSLLTGIPVKSDYAMTGEITLRGRVLPVGGIKEKIIAAHRYGITNVLIPAENEKDFKEDIPAEIRDTMNVQAVDTMDQVLSMVLEKPIKMKNLDSKIIRPFMSAGLQ